MTARRPIVRVGGRDQQLPVGDTLDLPLATTAGPGLMAAADKAKLDVSVGQNLLINGDFSVNQRGYAGAALPAGAYGYDRWGAYNGGVTYSVSDGTVTLSSGVLCQVIESPKIAGQLVTLSLDNPSATLTVTLGNGSGASSVSGTISPGAGRRAVSLVVPAGVTGDLKVRIAGPGSFSRVKLELGPVATRYFDGVQVDRCLRYFTRFDAPLIPMSGFTDGAAFYLPFTVQMRTAPAGATNITDANFSIEANVSAGKWGIQMAGVAVVTKTGTVNVQIGFPTRLGACVFLFGATFSRTSDLFVGATGILVTFDAELTCTD